MCWHWQSAERYRNGMFSDERVPEKDVISMVTDGHLLRFHFSLGTPLAKPDPRWYLNFDGACRNNENVSLRHMEVHERAKLNYYKACSKKFNMVLKSPSLSPLLPRLKFPSSLLVLFKTRRPTSCCLQRTLSFLQPTSRLSLCIQN